MIVPSFLINQAEIAKGVKKVEKMFKPDVVRIEQTVAENWMGDTSLYVHVVMSDAAANRFARAVKKRDYGREFVGSIEEAFYELVDPHRKWGLFPYFSYGKASRKRLS